MSRAHQAPRDRAGFVAAPGVLLVVRTPPAPPAPSPGQPPSVPADPAEGPEIVLAVWNDGSVNGLAGHVDLGTGLATALAQLAAEELDVPLEAVHMLLGDTARVPNQGPTIASASIQIHSLPLRQAAASARRWLIEQAAPRLGLAPGELEVDAGVVRCPADTARALSYAQLVGDRHVSIELDAAVALKPPAQWRVAGRSAPRVDIPAKVTGQAAFVHDVRLPGLLHGRVVRPPYAGADHGDFVGRTLIAVERDSVAHIPGVVAVVQEGDFVGVVAEREEQAEAAMRALVVRWRDWPGLPVMNTPDAAAAALRVNPATPRVVADKGDVEAARTSAERAGGPQLQRRYVWPYQLHASIGPSCAVAHWQPGESGARLMVWAGTQNPHVLRADIAVLVGLHDVDVEIVRLEAAGCYGRNGADDVAADAALLSRAVGAPVRVQLTREQEHQWEPKGAAQWMEVAGALDVAGRIESWELSTSYPSNAAPTLALLLTGRVPSRAEAYAMGDRTSVPPYRAPNLRVTVNDMPPILRASWLRGVSALPNTFAHECFVDELAQAAGADPVQFRLAHLDDERAAELLRATADKAGWKPHTAAQQQGSVVGQYGPLLKGQGVAYARYTHSKFPGFGAAWSAWVADVEVNALTGEVHVSRVVVGHDAGALVNPAGVTHQVHGNVVQTASRALLESVQQEPQRGAVASREWGSYPILSFRQVPVIEVLHMPRPDEDPLGAGESSSVPGTAAIANAIFDATGVRLREPPFTPEVVRAALRALPGAEAPRAPVAGTTPVLDPLPNRRLPPDAPLPRRRGVLAAGAAMLGGVAAFAAALFGWRSVFAPIAPATRPDASIYTAATLERGRQIAAVGNCLGCHTQPGVALGALGTPGTQGVQEATGPEGAGGRVLPTPFGDIVSTNITPDVATGIGAWSFAAFQRAMREGIARDGRHLYPAFPYTAFARMPDDELMALYAYLMSRPAVQRANGANRLEWPFSWRPLLALWNGLYLGREAAPTTASIDTLWQRGEYLVNGPGHCGACHTPRNGLGAERGGPQHLAGALVEGWEAPALTALNAAALSWTEADFFDYLRRGYSARHGVAAGPMAGVVASLAAANDGDIQAMARYLVSLQASADPAALTAERTAGSAREAAPPPDAAARLFTGACGACHAEGSAAVEIGLNLPLALNTNIRSERPHNVLRVMLDGIRETATREVAPMPAFRDSLDDMQLATLAAYLRRRYAPDLPPWGEPAALARLAAQLRVGSRAAER